MTFCVFLQEGDNRFGAHISDDLILPQTYRSLCGYLTLVILEVRTRSDSALEGLHRRWAKVVALPPAQT